MRASICLLLAVTAFLSLPTYRAAPPPPRPPSARPSPPPPVRRWSFLWSDEFGGTALRSSKWDAQIANGCQYGLGGWGNNERQWYTDLPQNLRVENGNLVLQAVYDPAASAIRGQPFTSARVRTAGKFAVVPTATSTIRIEARIKVPQGLGLWPAFWLLPEEGSSASCSGCGRHGTWAASGEIDVMEVANNAMQTFGTLHFGGEWPANACVGNAYSLPSGAPLSDAFHVYALEWEQKQMRWYVDGRLTQTQYSGNGTRAGWFSLGRNGHEGALLPGDAPFDLRYHLILNLALGSEGTPFTMMGQGEARRGITEEQLKATLAQPKAMLVDYVRVWSRPRA